MKVSFFKMPFIPFTTLWLNFFNIAILFKIGSILYFKNIIEVPITPLPSVNNRIWYISPDTVGVFALYPYFIFYFILQYFSATTRIALKANECLSRTLSHYTNTEKVKLEILSPSSLVSISQELCSCNSTILEGHRFT